MKASNNLNQLLSRVKTIFGRKATSAANTPLEAEPSIGIASVSDPRLSAAFADIEKYLADNYNTPTTKLRYQDYTNGASLTSEAATCSIARNPDSHERSRPSPRQRTAAWRSHLDQRCRMARRRVEKVHQLPHAALPQAPHPAPRFRLLQRQT